MVADKDNFVNMSNTFTQFKEPKGLSINSSQSVAPVNGCGQ